jgi:hypothetical protein
MRFIEDYARTFSHAEPTPNSQIDWEMGVGVDSTFG